MPDLSRHYYIKFFLSAHISNRTMPEKLDTSFPQYGSICHQSLRQLAD